MWVLVLAILVGVVVLATGMRSSVDEAWIEQTDGDPSDVDDLGQARQMSADAVTLAYPADRAA